MSSRWMFDRGKTRGCEGVLFYPLGFQRQRAYVFSDKIFYLSAGERIGNLLRHFCRVVHLLRRVLLRHPVLRSLIALNSVPGCCRRWWTRYGRRGVWVILRVGFHSEDVHRAGYVVYLLLIIGRDHHRHRWWLRSGCNNLRRIFRWLISASSISHSLGLVGHVIRGEARLERRPRQFRGPLTLGAVDITDRVHNRVHGAFVVSWVTVLLRRSAGQLGLIVFVTLWHLIRQITEVYDELLRRILQVHAREEDMSHVLSVWHSFRHLFTLLRSSSLVTL